MSPHRRRARFQSTCVPLFWVLGAFCVQACEGAPSTQTRCLTELPVFAPLGAWLTVPVGVLTRDEAATQQRLLHARPLLVVLHGCGQSVQDIANAGFDAAAQERGFLALYPEQKTERNALRCFSWWDESTQRPTGVEAQAISNMIAWVRARYSISEVYVAGLSAGAATAANLVANQPTTFTGGAFFAGVGVGCTNTLLGASLCMSPGGVYTRAAWRDRLQALAPTFAGTYPKVIAFAGLADLTVAPRNTTILAEQFAGVGAEERMPTPNVRTYLQNGTPVAQTVWVENMGHAVPIAASGCGVESAYVRNAGVCGVRLALDFWGVQTIESDVDAAADATTDADIGAMRSDGPIPLDSGATDVNTDTCH